MYSGDNKTALASQKTIADTLIELLKIKPYSDISISELCKESKVSRQTFYKLFKSKENVIAYELKKYYQFSLETQSDKEIITLKEICYYCSLYIKENYEFIKLIVLNGLTDILYECLYEGFISCKRIISKEHEDKRNYIATFAAGGLTSIIKNYVKEDRFDDDDFIEKITYSLFSGTYFN